MEALPLPQSVAAWLQVVDEGLYLSRARGAQRPARAPYLRPRTHAGGFQLSKGSQKSGLSSRPDRACNHASFARVNRRTPPLTRGSGPRRRRLARSAHAIEASALRARPRWRPPEAARDLRPHGVLRRRLVAGEVCRLQALPRVTALLTALLLAPQAGWPCRGFGLGLGLRLRSRKGGRVRGRRLVGMPEHTAARRRGGAKRRAEMWGRAHACAPG